MTQENINYLEIIREKLKDFKLELRLIAYGNYLAEENKYPENIRGLDSINLTLSIQNKWTLTYLRNLSISDIYSLVHKDLDQFQTPPALQILLDRLYVHD